MRLLEGPVTRRSALFLIGSGAAATTVAATGTLAYVLNASGIVGHTAAVASNADPQQIYPVGGSGVFDVDPDQDDLSQDPGAAIDGDIASLPVDLEL